MGVEINFLAVIMATVVSMVIGFIWYSPLVLGKQWMKEHKYTSEMLKKKQKEAGKWYAVSTITTLITAYVLAHVMVLSISFFKYGSLQTGLTSGFWMWFGFVMTTQFTATIFSDKHNFKLFGIDTGYQLVSLLSMGAVLGLMN